MARIGYHISHEQFAPSHLLRLLRKAQAAGFSCANSSDHFHPWSERQGQSGFAWAWLGAAMEHSTLPLGLITAPGYRYHPAVVAQGAATLAEMYPGRFTLALGSGEAINEAITGEAWPEKDERNERLRECAEIIRNLLAGEEVTHRGRVTVIGAKLYSRPAVPVPIFGAALSPESAAFVGGWADGLLTVGGKPSEVKEVIRAFNEAGGAGKPVHIQHGLCWAQTEADAMAEAMHQWAPLAVGGDVLAELRKPADFDHTARLVSEEMMREAASVSADISFHIDRIAALAELADTVLLHQIGRNQEEFIDLFGARALPHLH